MEGDSNQSLQGRGHGFGKGRERGLRHENNFNVLQDDGEKKLFNKSKVQCFIF